jgi:hypothetical protein
VRVSAGYTEYSAGYRYCTLQEEHTVRVSAGYTEYSAGYRYCTPQEEYITMKKRDIRRPDPSCEGGRGVREG